MRIAELRALDVRSADADTLALALGELKLIDTGYSSVSSQAPDWVIEKQISVDRELKERVANELRSKLAIAQKRRAGLATADEKRAALDAEIEGLKKALA